MGMLANILLVEDDLPVRQALGELFSTESFQVTTAASFTEARSHLQRDGKGMIDALVLDLGLDNEHDQIAARLLNEVESSVPVILMTTSQETQFPPAPHRDRLIFMTKPLDLPRLLELLQSLTKPSGQPRPGTIPLVS